MPRAISRRTISTPIAEQRHCAKAADGSVTVQFGGYDGKVLNCLPTMAGWNYMVRLYRPHAEILSGKWKFPEAQPAS